LKKWKFEKNWKYDALRIVKAKYASIIQWRVVFDVRFNGNCLDELEWKKFVDYRVPLSDKYKSTFILSQLSYASTDGTN
jgi:hypothetical protein